MQHAVGFVPHAERIHDGPVDRWMLVLHGVFGSSSNFRGIARRLARERPGWGFVLADLRAHGRSQGAPPPHTVATAADDLLRLDADVRAVAGHSFGGKVALAYAQRRPELEEIWILDSQPGARGPDSGPGSTTAVLHALEETPQPLPDRATFVRRLQPAFGRRLAEWLAMSLRAGGDGYRFVLDLPAIRALLDDYWSTDLWHVLEDPARSDRVRAVLGGRSGVVPPDDRARLARSVRVDVLERAGHWLHGEDPDGVVRLMSAGPVQQP